MNQVTGLAIWFSLTCFGSGYLLAFTDEKISAIWLVLICIAGMLLNIVTNTFLLLNKRVDTPSKLL